MATKKKVTQVSAKKESVAKPDVNEVQDAIIRDLVAVIKAAVPGREFTALARAERYLAEKEKKDE